jgi:hypothetical protein
MPFPRDIGVTSLKYLHSRDALTLPCEALQVEALKAYVEFVHGTMPLLDLEEFLSAVQYGYNAREITEKKQIPLLLFQAVLFAGVSFTNMEALKEAGYRSRGSAQREFFSRVRVSLLPTAS